MVDRLIVKPNLGVSAQQINELGKAMDVVSIETVGLTGAQIWHLSDHLTADEAIAKYSNSGLFEYIEPDYVIQLAPSSSIVTDETPIEQTVIIPDDDLFPKQWGLNNTGQSIKGQIGVVDADIDAPEAWLFQQGNARQVIGVLDTGVDYTHNDLSANIWANPGEIAGDGIDNDGNGYIDDVHGWDFANGDNDPMDGHGHGTRVAGIIAATGNNANGVTGVVWNAQIMPLKFINDDGAGTISDAILAINYATSMGVKLTNNSWGDDKYSAALYDAIQTAEQQGSLFIAGAGNGGADKIGDNNDITPFYPASYDLNSIISVTSTTSIDSLSSSSNYGTVSVDLAAPGSNIFSTIKGGAYGFSSGTSFSTPHVVGAAALLLSRYPTLTSQQIKDALLQSSDTLAPLTDMVSSNGRLNVNNALMLLNHAPSAENKTVSINKNNDYVFNLEDFGYSDADNDSLVSIQITGLATAGTLKFDGMEVLLGQVINTAEIDLLTFIPQANASGYDYSQFTFTVKDGISDSNGNAINFNVFNATIIGTDGNDRLFGTTGIDKISGLAGNDILNGRAGADTLIGGLGNDSYVVDDAGDIVTEYYGAGVDKVRSSITYILPANVEKLVLTGTSAIDGTGNELANRLVGNSAANRLDGGDGNDRLNGGAGADTLVGGLGNDRYIVDNAGDVVSENLGEGWDRVDSSVTYTLPNHVERLTLMGETMIDGTGNSRSNTLIGNSAANTLIGGDGRDKLDGKGGDNTLTGGEGRDIFKFTTIGHVDTITDYVVADDTIHLENTVFTALTSTGKLDADQFIIGVQALETNDFIIYNDVIGALFYDADGSGVGTAIQIATVGTGLAMTNEDIVVI